MKNTNLKTRILIPLTLVLCVLLSVFIFNVYQTYYNEIKSDIEKQLGSVSELYEKQLTSDEEVMNMAIALLSQNHHIQAAWLAKDRVALLKETSTILEDMRNNYQITHFYFHDLEMINFLRVHKPEKYGDKSEHIALLKAKNFNKSFAGVEIGRFGTFTLRVVHPWRINGQLVGYIEIGKEIDQIIRKLHNILGIELYVSIYKNFLDQKEWNDGLRMVDRKSSWDQLPSSVIVSQTLKEIPKALGDFLTQGHHDYMKMSSDLELSIKDRNYRIGAIPLFDAGEREVGDIVVLYDVTDQLISVRYSIIIISAICIVASLILFTMFFVILGRVEKQMNISCPGIVESINKDITTAKVGEEGIEQELTKEYLSPVRVLAITTISIFIAELIVMFVLSVVPPIPSHIEIFFDSFMLLGLVSPGLYYFIFRPLIIQINERIRAELLLKKAHEELEIRVKERTADLEKINKELQSEITERKLAEEALLLEKQKVDNVSNYANCGLLLLDEKTKVTYANKFAEEWFGPLSQIKGKFCWEVFKIKNPEIECAGLKVLRSGKTVQSDTFIELLHGENKYFYVVASPVKNSQGKIIQISEVVIDITERKQTEEKIKEINDCYERLIDNADEAVFRVKLGEGEVIYANPAAERIFGYSMKEWQSDPALGFKIIHPDYIKKQKQIEEEIITNKKTIKNTVLGWITKDGREVFVEYTIIPLLDKDGQVTSFESIGRDITERKRTEKELQRFKFISDNSSDAHFLLCRDSKFQYVNKTACEMLGYSENELLTLGVPDVDTLYDIAKYQELFDLTQTETVPPIETINKRKDGTVFPAEITVTGVQINGKLHMFAALRNITDRKKAEEELKRSREELRNLTAHLQSVREEERISISREIHDVLGQALTALQIELSNLTKKLPQEKKPLIKKAEKILELVDMSMDTVQRISSDLRPNLLDKLGIIPAIKRYAKEFQARTGIKCMVTSHNEQINLNKDLSTAIFRIFQETLTNVVRHANATTIRTDLKKENNCLILKMMDDGKGIDEKEMSSPKSFGIIGMRERADFVGGKIKIKGTKNKGTTVTVTIPLSQYERHND